MNEVSTLKFHRENMDFALNHIVLTRCSNYSRSARALSHADRLGALAFWAFPLYVSRSAGVTRTFIRTLAGSFMGGLPLGRLGWSMG